MSLYLSNWPTTMSDSVEGNKLHHTDCRNFPCYTNYWRHLVSTAALFPVLLAGILHSVERPGSVCSIMPQWWHLTVSQYVAASFQPNVSKHCRHQHRAIHTTTQAVWNTNNPISCDIQGAASSVQHHGSPCPQPQKILVWHVSRQ